MVLIGAIRLIDLVMKAMKILESILDHVSQPLEHWRVIKRRPRVHPYDEMDLLFPSLAWVHLLADSPEEADKAVSMVLEHGIAEFQNSNQVYSQHLAVFKIPPVN